MVINNIFQLVDRYENNIYILSGLKLHKHFRVFFLITFAAVVFCAQSQERPNLDEYTLDTVIQPSGENPAVMDTFIIARKKVVVTKKVIIENEILLEPTLSNHHINLFISPDIYINGDSEQNTSTQYVSKEMKPGYSLGLSYTADLKKRITLSCILSYAFQKETLEKQQFSEHILEQKITIPDTLDTYYIITLIDTIPFHIIEDKEISVYNTVADTNYSETLEKYNYFDIELGVSKHLAIKKLHIYPGLSIGYRSSFRSGEYSNNADDKIQDIQSRSSLKIGFSCPFLYQINTRFGVSISPQIAFFNKNYIASNNRNTMVYSTKVGFFVTIQ